MLNKISKRDYRQRAHSNPFKDLDVEIPTNPQEVDWTKYFANGSKPEFLDIGCGYGRFMFESAKIHKDNILGLEIREKVYEYVKNIIKQENLINVGVIKTNALLFLPNFFEEKSLKKVFVLFPDPHFKKRKQKGRVICCQMMNILEYILEDKGRLYISTDVKELFSDMVETVLKSGFFTRLSEEEAIKDDLYEVTYKNTDEALRAGVKSGHTFGAIFIKNKN
ncbi:tRNA (guanine-N(7)-)-methyltransferase [Nosema granulosis]|uniref:tRNA (guanine-N(7)-)-methyltransferase n=1 Tax=Nosema granulosis TaxID=83296 RepID=A0A9P6GYU4_9MICR|nr:tRNA (guanine-N(7)-)-methyltransferase [Nosema granulosis]